MFTLLHKASNGTLKYLSCQLYCDMLEWFDMLLNFVGNKLLYSYYNSIFMDKNVPRIYMVILVFVGPRAPRLLGILFSVVLHNSFATCLPS